MIVRGPKAPLFCCLVTKERYPHMDKSPKLVYTLRIRQEKRGASYGLFKVVGCIVLIGSAVWAVRTVRRQQYNSLGKYIHVLERILIGSGQTLLYLEVDDIGVVVGATPQRFDVIYITDYKPSEVERETYSRSGNVFQSKAGQHNQPSELSPRRSE